MDLNGVKRVLAGTVGSSHRPTAPICHIQHSTTCEVPMRVLRYINVCILA